MDHNTTTNTNGGAGRDWSSLPADVLFNITDNFLPLSDYIHFRAVCKSWSHSVPRTVMPSPLLLLSGHGDEYGEHTDDSLAFFSFASPQTTFHSPAPPYVAGTHCAGSHDGWLAMCGPTLELFIFNPFTAERIDLPPFTTLPDFELVYETADDGSAVVAGFRGKYSGAVRKIERRRCYVRKIVFNSSPTAENFMAMALDMYTGVVYCRAGEDRWSSFSGGEDSEFYRRGVHDVLFHDGRFWVLNERAMLFGFDLGGRGSPEVTLAFKGYDGWREFSRAAGLGEDLMVLGDKYLGVGEGGNIVMVIRDGRVLRQNESPRRRGTRRLVLMEFVSPEFDRARPVRSLGRRSLFVGNNSGFSLPVDELHVMRGNCVYLTDILRDSAPLDAVHGMGVFDVEKQSFELLFPEYPLYNWCHPLPTWFIPNMKRNCLESALGKLTMK